MAVRVTGDEVDFVIKKDDLLPEISAVLKDDNGNIADLTTATGVNFHMYEVQNFKKGKIGSTKVDAAASVVGAPVDGTVKYTWTGTDTDTPDVYFAEFEVTLPSSKPMTFPNDGYLVVQVVESLD